MADQTAKPFAHLHLHTQYSLLDGGNRIDRLVKRVKELGMDSVAITDHGNMFGAVEFYTRCKDAGLKPILGIEAYVAADIDGKPSDRTNREFTGVSDGGFHLVLLAENQVGWQHLLKLSSDAYINGFYFKPRMDKTTLQQWSKGLIAINGHLGSSIAYYLVKYEQTSDEKYYELAKKEAVWHKKIFGPNEDGEPCFFIELQYHAETLQRDINKHAIRLAREVDVPLVCDNDAHFLTADDWDAHDSLCCISMGKIKSDPNRLHYPKDLYVKSPQEMAKHFVGPNADCGEDMTAAVENTAKIAARCDVQIDFGANHALVVKIVSDYDHLPTDSDGALKLIDAFKCEHPVGSTEWFKAFCKQFRLEPYDSENDSESPEELKLQCDGALRMLTEAGGVWRYGRDGVDEEKRARMERELQVLADKLISAYFMIVWDFVNEARSRGIPCNARGSGVGTMVGFCLGLSNACPVDYGLLFERFTDPDRTEYPDIDIDICQDGRQEIIEYVRNKYGHVAQIITYGTLKARAAIRDVGRVLDVPLSEVDKVCKLVGDGLGTTLEKALAQEPDLKQLYDQSPQHRAMIDTAMRLEGMARHAGVHAAGVIVATQPLDNICPLYKPPGTEQIVTQWDGPTCEKVGLLKMDFLGLRTLSIIERAKKLVKQTLSTQQIRNAVDPEGKQPDSWDPLDLERLQFDDQKVLSLFSRGETAGVFQFESGGMRNLLMSMKPDRLEDLIAANALYRPGPMELIPNYNNRKHGREQVPKVHEIVDRLTAETYGIMVYQEQVMQVINQLGGIPLRQAYSIIKAISKKKEKVINAARVDFVDGAGEKGVDKKLSGELFDLILKFAGYGFNKSHSTGYAIVAYQTAYLKTYFPVHYMAALLTYESVSTEKVVEYIDECKHVLRPNGQRGVEVKPPAINLSDIGFTVVYDKGETRDPSHGHIRFGLSAVKGVGEKAIRAILEEREKKGPFQSLYDFCERVPLGSVNRSTIEALIKCGAFDEIHSLDQRPAMVSALDAAIQSGQRAAKDRSSGQMNFFGGFAEAVEQTSTAATAPEVTLPSCEPWSTNELLKHEKDVLGFYLSSHPLDQHRNAIYRFSTCSIDACKSLAADVPIIIGGMLSRVKPTMVKKGRSAGQKMAMLTLDDGKNSIDAVAFSDVYATTYHVLQNDRVVFIKGKVDRRREEPSIIVDSIVPIEQAAESLTQTVKIVVHDPTPPEQNTAFNGEFNRLRELLRQASNVPGRNQAEVLLELHQGQTAVSLRVNGLRVGVDANLAASIETVMNHNRAGQVRCELLGPAKLQVAGSDPELMHDEASFDRSNMLSFASRKEDGESCESIDRY